MRRMMYLSASTVWEGPLRPPAFVTCLLLLFMSVSSGYTSDNTIQSPAPSSSTVHTDSMADTTLKTAYSEAIGHDDPLYHFYTNGSGYSARNMEQGFAVDVSSSAVTISISDDTWQLASDIPVRQFTAAGNRLTLHRDGFDEWYINGPLGLQQGFTLNESAAITFEVGGSLPTIAREKTLDIGDVLTFAGLTAYDAIGQNVPVAFNLTQNKLVYVYHDAGATYPLTIDPWVQQAKLTASDGAADAWFGHSVALYGDTALVGAVLDDDNGASSGSAYVFVRSGMMWSQQAKLVPNDGAAGDNFGTSVALSGDTALIGSPWDDCAAGDDCGSAYVFVRSGTTWTREAKLTASDGPQEHFGSSVALEGNTALIGAPRDDFNGAAYVFTRSGVTWSQQAKLTASDGTADDWFGVSVALSSDTALIGAYRDNCTAGAWCGSAYVFTQIGGIWTQQTKLTGSDGDADDQFGWSVALSGETALVGAYGDDADGADSGSAYVFVRSGTIWSQQAKLTASDGAADDWFGYALALDGDTALVGARQADNTLPDTGSAYAFTRSGTMWSQQAKLTASDGAGYDNFGGAVALSGNTVLAGAIGDDDDGSFSGSAYVFFLAPDQPLTTSATCNGPDLDVTISAGDAPFNITASAGINTPVNGVSIGTTTINGPEKWDNLTVTETIGDAQSINLGQFKCRTEERPVPLTPAHQSHTTNAFPLFSWTAITGASNYRVFVFDNKVVASRTVDIRQNSGGPTSMMLSTPLPNKRLFWRVRGRQNRLWSLWSVRFTLFKDPAPPFTITTPVPTIDFNPPAGDDNVPFPVPTFPAPPNSR